MKSFKFKQIDSEELANAITHGAGFILSVLGLIFLLQMAISNGNGWQIVSFSIYGMSLVTLYAASTLYHIFTKDTVKRVFKLIDHCAIYFLIAGTYTPFTLLLMNGTWGWSLFAIVWLLAIGGIVFKIFCINKLKILSTVIYLLMGWMVIVAYKPLVNSLSPEGLFWIAAGGASYTIGVVFYLWEKLKYNHAIWHLFVLGGSVSHFIAIYFFLL